MSISEIDDTSSAANESLYNRQIWNERNVASTAKYQKGKQVESSTKVLAQSHRNTSPENFTDGLQEDIFFEKIPNVLPS